MNCCFSNNGSPKTWTMLYHHDFESVSSIIFLLLFRSTEITQLFGKRERNRSQRHLKRQVKGILLMWLIRSLLVVNFKFLLIRIFCHFYFFISYFMLEHVKECPCLWVSQESSMSAWAIVWGYYLKIWSCLNLFLGFQSSIRGGNWLTGPRSSFIVVIHPS